MKCKTIKRRLGAYNDGYLSKSELARINQHLAECEDCRRDLRSLSQLADLLRSTGSLELSPDFAEQVWERIEQLQNRPIRKRRGSRWLPQVLVPAACVAALTLGILVGGDLQQVTTTQNGSAETLLVSALVSNMEELPGDSVTSEYLTLVDVENGS